MCDASRSARYSPRRRNARFWTPYRRPTPADRRGEPVCNYAGDNMNVKMAMRKAKAMGIEVKTW
jgi:hypothetical protein